MLRARGNMKAMGFDRKGQTQVSTLKSAQRQNAKEEGQGNEQGEDEIDDGDGEVSALDSRITKRTRLISTHSQAESRRGVLKID